MLKLPLSKRKAINHKKIVGYFAKNEENLTNTDKTLTKNGGGKTTYVTITESNTMLKTATLATTIALASFGLTNAAEAAQITLNGTDYEVSTVVGTYDNLSSTLSMTPWFGDENLARSAATQVGNALGLPNLNGSSGPYFW
ncbi:putative transposase [Crocosphaera subtropica ATCC 51142]|uniref:Transposase n=2 Tax=Crocosphaera TaxID=263510 RepID=B1WV73_CROS5|nr:putative transposase [Crocosphaera subtropica ATCC 51142]